MEAIIEGVDRRMEKETVVLRAGKLGDIVKRLDHLGVVLPSDPAWRTANYFRLVELHRNIKPETPKKMSKIIPVKFYERGFPALGMWALKYRCKRPYRPPLLTVDAEPALYWTDRELVIASLVLTETEYSEIYRDNNPEQMRRVIGLAYDILRFRPVLDELLKDMLYFARNPTDRKNEQKVHLILYEMICRGFKKRPKPENWRDFQKNGLDIIYNSLWENRLSVAAEFSRLRIRKQARILDEVLPRRLNIPSKLVKNPIVQGFFNLQRLSCFDLAERLKELGYVRHIGTEALPPNTFSEDHLLPFFFHIRPNDRREFLNSSFIGVKEFILQGRTTCISPAVVAAVMKQNNYKGGVVQTDVISLSSVAYLAELLHLYTNTCSYLYVFGAGKMQRNYEEFFRGLGAYNVTVRSEEFCDVDPKDPIFECVVMVYACPPSSNSSVMDPVELCISRGGDMSVLYKLTNSVRDWELPEKEILHKQKYTLQRAMSIPQIQGIVYETFSEFECENQNMAKTVIDEMNSFAAEKHCDNINILDFLTESNESLLKEYTPEVQVPLCDMFEFEDIPDICPHAQGCLDLSEHGVYIAYIKRKRPTKLDSKFMISMAEERGLFGSSKGSVTQGSRKLSEPNSATSETRRHSVFRFDLSRLTAPTIASNAKNIRFSTICPKLVNSSQTSINRRRFKTQKEQDESVTRIRRHTFISFHRITKKKAERDFEDALKRMNLKSSENMEDLSDLIMPYHSKSHLEMMFVNAEPTETGQTGFVQEHSSQGNIYEIIEKTRTDENSEEQLYKTDKKPAKKGHKKPVKTVNIMKKVGTSKISVLSIVNLNFQI